MTTSTEAYAANKDFIKLSIEMYKEELLDSHDRNKCRDLESYGLECDNCTLCHLLNWVLRFTRRLDTFSDILNLFRAVDKIWSELIDQELQMRPIYSVLFIIRTQIRELVKSLEKEGMEEN